MSRRLAVLVLTTVLVVGAVPAATGQQVPGGRTGGAEDGFVVGRPDLSVTAATGEFEAGTTARLGLVVSNAGRLQKGGPERFERRVQTARGLRLDVGEGSTPIDVTDGTVAVGSVPPGAAPPVEVEITVPEGTAPGTYRLPVKASYTYTAGVDYGPHAPEYNDYDREDELAVEIRVTDDARFEIVDVDSTAQVGDTGTVSVAVANVGTEPARDATVRLTSTSDELSFGSRSRASSAFVASWAPGERRVLNYTVAVAPDAALRRYVLDARVRYEDTQGIVAESAPLAVGIRPAREQTFALRNVAANLRAGREGEFVATVVNRGPERVRKPVVVLRATDPAVTVETVEAAIQSLGPGDRARVRFDVSVGDSVSAGGRQLNLTVRYRNQRGELRVSDPLERQVRIRPERDRFGIEAVDGTVRAGSSGTLELRITNRGDERLQNVELQAFVDDPLSSDDDQAIVDTLAPGRTATVTLGIEAGGTALAKTYPLSLDLQFELPDGDTELSRTYTVPVTVEQERGRGLPVLPVVVVVAVLVGGGVWWWRTTAAE